VFCIDKLKLGDNDEDFFWEIYDFHAPYYEFGFNFQSMEGQIKDWLLISVVWS
jgi:hypothetical protein